MSRRVPLDAALGQACDAGEPVPEDSLAGVAFKQIIAQVTKTIES